MRKRKLMTDTIIEKYKIYKVSRNQAQSSVHCQKYQA